MAYNNQQFDQHSMNNVNTNRRNNNNNRNNNFNNNNYRPRYNNSNPRFNGNPRFNNYNNNQQNNYQSTPKTQNYIQPSTKRPRPEYRTPPASDPAAKDRDGKVKTDCLMGDLTYYFNNEDEIRRWKNSNLKFPKTLDMVKHHNKSFTKCGVDLDKKVIRSLIICCRECWFNDNNMDYTENDRENSVATTIETTLTNIKTLYKATTYFVVCTGSNVYKGLLAYACYKTSMVLMDISPINLEKFESFKPEDRPYWFTRRTVHYLRYHHREIEQRLANVSDDRAVELL